MNFNGSEYALFLPVVFLISWLLARRSALRLGFLLAASWFFYASWKAPYLLLILFSTLLDYWAGAAIARREGQDAAAARRRRQILIVSLVGNLGCLALFKYHGFFSDNLEALLAGSGVHIPRLDLVLPVGISFYTFQTLSYTIDIYRGELRPARNLGEFALFVAFFPQLVAGPIVRAREFLPQLAARPRLAGSDFQRGLFRIMEGLAKKVLVADVIALGLVDRTFAPGSAVGGAEALLGIYAYAVQVYCDFAGYSDIAIGSALLLGFRIPENFDAPLKACSIRDFWRRWHISLSTWLRDYLYIPLGGNRKGPLRANANLMATMLLGGLWHGAGWNFVSWGGMHGALLVACRLWERMRLPVPRSRPARAASVFLTFNLFCLSLVVFRCAGPGHILDLLGRLGDGWRLPGLAPTLWLSLGAGFASHFLPESWKSGVERFFVGLPAPAAGAALALFLGLLALARVEGIPFIYFQF